MSAAEERLKDAAYAVCRGWQPSPRLRIEGHEYIYHSRLTLPAWGLARGCAPSQTGLSAEAAIRRGRA